MGNTIRRMLRAIAQRFPNAARHARYFKYNVRDVYDTYIASPHDPVPTPLGFKFGGLASHAHAAMRQGLFEPAEVSLLETFLPHVDEFVDVGANAGYFTCLARGRGKPVIAIEPMPRNLAALFKNLQANHWTDTEVLPLGVSSKPGVETLYGASGTGASLIDNWAGAPSAFKRTICVSTMDRLLAGRPGRPRFLVKIDVEGNEYRTLQGAAALIAQEPRPVWLVEITLHEYHPSGRNPDFEATFALFFSGGYRAFLVRPNQLDEVTPSDVGRWVAAGKTDSLDVNYLFVPPDMIAHVLPAAG